MDEIKCSQCGSSMEVSEYDSDEDAYLYQCVECRYEEWVEIDDETWK